MRATPRAARPVEPSVSRFDPQTIAAPLAARRSLRVRGLRGSAPAFAVAAALPRLDGPLLWITADEDGARHAADELRVFAGELGGGREVLHYPASDVEPYGGLSPHAEVTRRRIAILARLHDGRPDVVVASVAALLRRVIPRAALGGAQELLATGEEVDRDALVAALVAWGYLSTDRTEDAGCFSVRGHVLDLYPPGFQAPLRVEFWGDEIDSIRSFDPVSQRSLAAVEEVVLLPVREELVGPGTVDRFRDELGRLSEEREIPPRQRQRLVDELERGHYFAGIEDFLPLFHETLDSPFDYLGADATLVIDGSEDVERQVRDEPALVRRAFAGGSAPRSLVPDPDRLYLDAAALQAHLVGWPRLVLPTVDVDEDAGDDEVALASFDHASLRSEILAAAEREGGMLSPLLQRVERWRGDGLRVIVACRSGVQAGRVAEMLRDHDVPAARVDAPLTAAELRDAASPLNQVPGQVSTVVAPLRRGFGFPAAGVAVVAQAEIFGARRGRRTRRRDRLGEALTSFSELREGDHVVHAAHGIGRFLGIHKLATPKSQQQKQREFLQRARDPSYNPGDADVRELEATGSHNDYLLLEYRGGDRLYMPVHKLDLLHRYAAVEGARPALDRLGGQGWSKRRKKAEEAAQKFAAQLLDLYAAREEIEAAAMEPPDQMYREFAASFPFDETDDQLEAIRAIQEDLQQPRPMDRLLCGDVGYGKTEVALRAAVQAVLSGHQVAVLVPTTILALQHHQTFLERLAQFPVRIEMLSRFVTARHRRKVIHDLAEGGVDIVVGTQALLGKEVSIPRLGLLVIDEEHRFGVRQKERIKELRHGVDVLTMTATPIPRTLNMALSGIRTFSLIDTAPEGRREVRTHIVRFSKERIREAIERELRRGGQVFFVHNRVRSIGAAERFLRKLLPGVTIGVAHGQMTERQLEAVMVDFVRRKYQVLLCTTIIESGIDIPSCNTILIHRADRMGLAQLHQLRGRVGRGRDRGYAYLLVPPGRAMSGDAVKRLKALQDNASLGSGFRLASRDLEIRGAGNLLGKEQSGNVNAVGLHTYLDMLREAVRGLRGEGRRGPDPEIEIRTDAYIPADYIPDQRDRLLYYKRLSDADSEGEALDLVEELEDLYGRAPDPVTRLVELIQLKVAARQRWVTRIAPVRGGVQIAFDEQTPVDPARLLALVQRAQKRLTLSQDGVLTVRLNEKERREPLPVLKRLLHRLG